MLLLSSILLYKFKLFSHSIDENLGYFQFEAIISKTAMNILIQVFLSMSVFISFG